MQANYLCTAINPRLTILREIQCNQDYLLTFFQSRDTTGSSTLKTGTFYTKISSFILTQNPY